MRSSSLSPSPAQRELDELFLHGSEDARSTNTTQAQPEAQDSDEEVVIHPRHRRFPERMTEEEIKALSIEEVAGLFELHQAGAEACQEIKIKQINGLTLLEILTSEEGTTALKDELLVRSTIARIRLINVVIKEVKRTTSTTMDK